MKNLVLILFLLLGVSISQIAQEKKEYTIRARVVEGDTVLEIKLREVEIVSLKIPKSKRAKRKLTKLVKNIKVVYPYAKLAGIQLRKYEHMLSNAATEKERRKIQK